MLDTPIFLSTCGFCMSLLLGATYCLENRENLTVFSCLVFFTSISIRIKIVYVSGILPNNNSYRGLLWGVFWPTAIRYKSTSAWCEAAELPCSVTYDDGKDTDRPISSSLSATTSSLRLLPTAVMTLDALAIL